MSSAIKILKFKKFSDLSSQFYFSKKINLKSTILLFSFLIQKEKSHQKTIVYILNFKIILLRLIIH